MDVLCVDKKGTITMNQLAVIGVIALNHATESDVLFAGALASQGANQDPIDLAFLAAAKERQIFDGVTAVTPVSFAPFDAKNRRTKAVVEQNGQRLRVMKGAVRTVAEASGLQPPAIETLEARVSESALKGYRTLAIARGPEAGAPALVGLVTLYDPPRPDAKQLITALRDLDVSVKMLTGDALAVASEIAHGVGLPNIRRVADLKAAGAQAGNEAVDLLAAPLVSPKCIRRTNTSWCSIALATDHVRLSKKPETWNIGALSRCPWCWASRWSRRRSSSSGSAGHVADWRRAIMPSTPSAS